MSILLTLGMLIFMVGIHELGHYTVARICGVKVNEFAIGMGPKIFSFTKKDILYSLRLIPIGGYCSMEGESDDSTDENALRNKKGLVRLSVFLAGAICNIISAIILFSIVAALTPSNTITNTTIKEFYSPSRQDIEYTSMSNNYLQIGDKITKIEGKRVYGSYDLNILLGMINKDKFDITVLRNGQRVTIEDVEFPSVYEEELGYTTHMVDFKCDGDTKNLETVIKAGVSTSIGIVRTVLMTLSMLFTGELGLETMSGIVGITDVVGTVAKSSYLSVLMLLGIISINLGIFNLLPIPSLDGFHSFVTVMEMILRKRIPVRLYGTLVSIGFILLIGFAIYININDIVKLVF